MKSIKEKAEEYAKTKHTNQNLIEIVSWDFEAGANYVLDEIEPIIKADLGSYKFQLDKIKQTIEQLKSNQ